ncbi:MAG TPA: uracil-DNA glycosylase [Perlabentimonas sp.]|nr:uracil-DNA glycosylase [Bacteroidales bacterium]MDD4671885.1 uracil-DNA glycosylase [Bacteroidales bacterium]MDY0349169.1 uracil-DNA glycosylase [Tenuifilaceae bacterium]HZJ73742.1 uracil-DNA glycosylase [Perlabentimonas sp.]
MAYANVIPSIHDSWELVLGNEFQKEYFIKLKEFLLAENQQYDVYPSTNQIFNAFNSTPFQKVKVVILGQDPYHGDGQAHGLSFSVPKGVKQPPSLVNIFKEVSTDIGGEIPLHGNLSHWAQQGVLLLNATLTVRAHQAGSHQNRGWERFTDAAIEAISKYRSNTVFMLWGAYAQAKEKLIDTNRHYVLKAPHPSPLSAYRGFLGCKHFSQANSYLEEKADTGINWVIE